MMLNDLTGQTFGKLVVTERAENNRQGQARWQCACACGGTATVRATHLRGGRTTSCGCYRRAFRRKSADQITYNSAHYRVKRERGYAEAYPCVGCGGQAADWALRYDASERHDGDDGKGHPVQYSGNPSDYQPMCRKCHKTYDMARAR